jgi:hypothetical protein
VWLGQPLSTARGTRVTAPTGQTPIMSLTSYIMRSSKWLGSCEWPYTFHSILFAAARVPSFLSTITWHRWRFALSSPPISSTINNDGATPVQLPTPVTPIVRKGAPDLADDLLVIPHNVPACQDFGCLAVSHVGCPSWSPTRPLRFSPLRDQH